MIKFASLTAAATFALIAISSAANATPLARVGVGQVYNNVAACAAASGTYAPSEAAQAYARAHPAAGTPVFGENATGTICVLMHTSVPGRAEDGRSQGDHWVRVPKRFVYRASNGGLIFYKLCNNPILQVQEEVVAERVEEGPCLDCAPAQSEQPARQRVQVGLIAVSATTAVSHRQSREPLRISLIPVGGMPAAGSVYVGGSSQHTSVTYNQYGQPVTPTTPVITTQPPAGSLPPVITTQPADLPGGVQGLPSGTSLGGPAGYLPSGNILGGQQGGLASGVSLGGSGYSSGYDNGLASGTSYGSGGSNLVFVTTQNTGYDYGYNGQNNNNGGSLGSGITLGSGSTLGSGGTTTTTTTGTPFLGTNP